MKYEIVPDPEQARREIAAQVAKQVVYRLENRFAHADENGRILAMNMDDLRNYQTELTLVAQQALSEAGEVAADVYLARWDIDPNESNLSQFRVFMKALMIHNERNRRYKDQWKESGWRGALFDLRKKAARLFRQYWGAEPTEGANEDDAWDLINFAAFFIRGREAGNEWGNWL